MPCRDFRISNTTENFIINRKIEYDLKKEQYIYFLISNDKIVYVGQSQNVNQRLIAHTANKEFDSYSLFDITKPPFSSKYSICDIEAYFILKFNPIYNQTIPKNETFLTIKLAKIHFEHLKVKYKSTGCWFNKIIHLYNLQVFMVGNSSCINKYDFEESALNFKAEFGGIK